MLHYKTKNDSSPQGKRKVYFCCHPQDFDVYFASITEELLSITSCSVWYSDTIAVHRDEEFYRDLAQMNLVVVPVTSRLLYTDNPAMNEEIPFLLAENVPVLPLMQERDLDAAFGKAFHDLQYLDRCSQDDTAISYAEKLRKYLTAVLTEDEIVQRINRAFCAQLFLSYRKKDRRYAQMLMERIHENRQYQDVAIWYDEFLIPGEDFNQSIESQLNNSDAFILTVTQNLVNESNYVQSIEYPHAIKASKPIVPVEMKQTNPELLTSQYPGIPSCVDVKDARGLREALAHALPDRVTAAREYDPEREYLIGLAYLNGVSVEVNRRRALEMITSSANNGYDEAIERLAYMYRHGDGVRQDIAVAIGWQEKLVDTLRRRYDITTTVHDALRYATAYFEWAVMYQQEQFYDKANACLCDLKQELEKILSTYTWDEQTTAVLQRMQCLTVAVMAEIAHVQGDLKEEEELTDQGIAISEFLNQNWHNDYWLRDLSVLYRNKAMFYKVKHKISDAIACLHKALQIQELFAETSDEAQFRFDLAYTYYRLSELYRLNEKWAEAKKFSHLAIEKLERLLQDEGACAFIECKGLFYLGAAECYRFSGDMAEAIALLDKIDDILVKIEEVSGRYPWYTKYYCLLRRTQVYLLLGQHQQMLATAKMALLIQEEHQVIDDSNQLTGDTSLLSLHYLLSFAYRVLGEQGNALRCAETGIAYAEHLSGQNIALFDVESVAIYANYVSLLIDAKRVDEAKYFLDKAVNIAQQNGLPETGFRGGTFYFLLWFSYGRIRILEDRSEEAFRYLMRAEQCYDSFMQYSPAGSDLGEGIALYYAMGCCQLDLNPSLAKTYLQKAVTLVESTPESKRLLAVWDMLGCAYYFLLVVDNVFKKRKWTKKLNEFVGMMYDRYPEEFPQMQIYSILVEEGVIQE